MKPKLLFSSLALLLCAAGPSLAEQLSPTPVPLGVVAPLTGDFAPYGEHIKRGVELARLDLKKRGTETRVTFEDACLPAQVRSALVKLTKIDGIKGLVGSYCVIGMVASEPILESAKIVSFQTSGGTKEILDAGDYLFTTAGRTSEEARRLAEYAYRTLNAKTAAVLYLTTQWGEEFNQNFSERFAEAGGKITATATNPIGVNDFRTELTRLRSGDPAVLVIVHLASTLGIALKQAREIGFDKQILATTDAEERTVIDVAQRAAEGLTFLVPEPEEETAAMKRFTAEFRDKYKQDPHPLARHSYDATIIVSAALVDCRSDPECAKTRIYGIKNYDGASGIFTIDPDGGTKREFVLKTVKDGRFVHAD